MTHPDGFLNGYATTFRITVAAITTPGWSFTAHSPAIRGARDAWRLLPAVYEWTRRSPCGSTSAAAASDLLGESRARRGRQPELREPDSLPEDRQRSAVTSFCSTSAERRWYYGTSNYPTETSISRRSRGRRAHGLLERRRRLE
jgi:hypothetical protein